MNFQNRKNERCCFFGCVVLSKEKRSTTKDYIKSGLALLKSKRKKIEGMNAD